MKIQSAKIKKGMAWVDMASRSSFGSFQPGLKGFINACNITISDVADGSLMQTELAAQEIMQISLSQVPKDTSTLADSAFIKIQAGSGGGSDEYGALPGSNYSATFGYGDDQGVVNPKSGLAASDYMVRVHEDLSMPHPRGGKAKFLEDPVREYGKKWYQDIEQELKLRLSDPFGARRRAVKGTMRDSAREFRMTQALNKMR